MNRLVEFTSSDGHAKFYIESAESSLTKDNNARVVCSIGVERGCFK